MGKHYGKMFFSYVIMCIMCIMCMHWTAPCALQTQEGAPGIHQKWWTQCAVCVQCPVDFHLLYVACALCSVLCAVCCVQCVVMCDVYSVHCALCSVDFHLLYMYVACAVCIVQCAVCCVQCRLPFASVTGDRATTNALMGVATLPPFLHDRDEDEVDFNVSPILSLCWWCMILMTRTR